MNMSTENVTVNQHDVNAFVYGTNVEEIEIQKEFDRVMDDEQTLERIDDYYGYEMNEVMNIMYEINLEEIEA